AACLHKFASLFFEISVVSPRNRRLAKGYREGEILICDARMTGLRNILAFVMGCALPGVALLQIPAILQTSAVV
ncbi:MAG: hypothetical protein Q7T55_16900, partial [Solirubrobacteraceae bacterium]|nr:hypothetical protein [Solirubrobacteraceae bacterium]